MQAFNQTLQTPPTWTPIAGGPTVYAGNLSMADANVGPGLSGPDYLNSVEIQLGELKALGVKAVLVQVGFPVLYEPFFGSTSAMQPYLTFYQQLAVAVKAAGLKLIVENNTVLVNDSESGWTNLNAYFATLNWTEYMLGRATMAATVATTMQPDYLVLAEEPDTEALNSGQPNVNIPADAATMIAGEISAVRLVAPTSKLGAGFGSWPPAGGATLTSYIQAYVQLPLDYIDFHIYPINTENGTSIIGSSLTIASMAAAAGLPVAISEAYLWKMENNEFNVYTGDYFRARDPFGFWEPLNIGFFQTLQSLANYTNMIYVAPEGPQFLFAYQTYGGTSANGGAATCTCTTSSCDQSSIAQTENSLSSAANQIAGYTGLAYGYSGLLVVPPDTIAPTIPANLAATAGYTEVTLTWSPSTDNVGVAGYNILRCTVPVTGGQCTPAWITNTTVTSYIDAFLTSGTTYNYQVQAFDLVNNNSPLTPTLVIATFPTGGGGGNAPTNLTATAVSPKEINLAWTAPTGQVGSYLIYSGSTAATLQQVATVGGSSTTYKYQPLNAGTTYFFGVMAVITGVDTPLSNIVSATTLPLPPAPISLVATASSTTKIGLTWQEPAVSRGGLAVTQYQVLEGTTPGVLSKIATVTSPTYTKTGLTASTRYYFEVVAVDSANDDSVPSSEVSAVTDPLPPAPVMGTPSTPDATEIVLSWTWSPASGGLPLARYLVNCGLSPTTLTQVGTVTSGTTYTYRSLAAATKYYCDVQAVDSANDDSPASNIVSVTTPPLPPAPVITSETGASATSIVVNWTWSPIAGGLPFSKYVVNCGTSPTALKQVGSITSVSTTTYTYRGLTASTTYYCDVVASDSGSPVDNSPPSVIVSTKTLPMPPAPVITSATAPTNTSITLTWTWTAAPGGLPISRYLVDCGTSPTNPPQVGTSTTTTFTYHSAAALTKYYCQVIATDSANENSAPSAQVTVTTP